MLEGRWTSASLQVSARGRRDLACLVRAPLKIENMTHCRPGRNNEVRECHTQGSGPKAFTGGTRRFSCLKMRCNESTEESHFDT